MGGELLSASTNPPAGRNHAGMQPGLAHPACPATLQFDHSETPKAAMEKAFSEANYALLAAVQARDIHAMQSVRGAGRLARASEQPTS